MKTIKKLKNNMKTVAGSALLVGATLTAGAAAVTAQDSGSSGDLGDYPAPFVTEDGEVDTTVVVGETADDGEPVSTADVVSAVEIAGSLGNAAFEESETSVSVEGVAATWAAENGITLNRQNSQLYLGDSTDAEENRLDDTDLNVLETTSFQSEDGEEVELDHEVNVGSQVQNFNADVGDLDDPVLHVENPVDPESGPSNNLFSATVEFDESLDFGAAGDDDLDNLDADEAPEDGDEIEMFGNEFTFSEESEDGELVLYGSSDRFEVATGDSQTVTVDGEDHEFQVEYVSESGNQEATVIVDGDTQSVEESDTISLNGGEVRVSDIYRTGPDGQGRVAFAQGSDEVVLNDNGDVEVDGDTLDSVSHSVTTTDAFNDLDEITFYFGAEDSDEDYVGAGEAYEDPLFGMEFHYGGLAGNVAEDPASVLEVSAAEEGDATFTSTSQGEEADITFRSDDENDGGSVALAADEGEYISSFEGEHLEEDDYTVLNANEEAGVYEITNIDSTDLEDADTGSATSSADDETVGISLRNVHTGDTVEIEEDGLDFSGDPSSGSSGASDDDDRVDATGADTEYDDYTLVGESVEGKDFDITWNSDGTVSFDATSESNVAVYPHFYTAADGAAAFTETVDLTNSEIGLTTTSDVDLRMPSTVSSNDVELTATIEDLGGTGTESVSFDGTTLDIDYNGGGSSTSGVITVGQVEYYVEVGYSGSTLNSVDITPNDQDGGTSAVDPSVLYVQPEDDEDEEHGYVLTPQFDGTDDELTGDVDYGYTGTESTGASDTYLTASLDGEDVEVGYNAYGTYTEWDEESDDESFLLHVPAGQTPSGMAVTGADGSLSAEGGGSGSTTTMSPTYEYADAALDTDSNVGQAKQNQNLILVGGPNVNSLVQELVDDGQTQAASEYTEGEGMIQMVDGWSSGNSALVVAGHSGEDTRAAGEFLANYRDHASDLEGEDQVTISTETGSVVQ